MPIFRKDLHLGRKVPLVGSDDLSKDAVLTEKIADKAVTKAKLADDVMEILGELSEEIVKKASKEYVKALVKEAVDKAIDNASGRFMINVESNGSGVIALGETTHYTFEVWSGWNNPIDEEEYDVEWKIVRQCQSFTDPSVDPWNNSAKARAFDGEIDITWSQNASLNDLDPNEVNEATMFKVTAVIKKDGASIDTIDTNLAM